MRRVVLLTCLLIATLSVRAQDDPEYKMEVGAGIGLLSYQGDFNDALFKNQQPMASLLLRRMWNPYMGLRLAASYGQIKGFSNDVKTYYADYQTNSYDFKKSLLDVSLTYEYNFWPYGTGADYRGAKRLTPFVFLGLGGTYAKGDGNNVFTANVPLGIGVKYKLADRVNLGIEWAMHFTLNDKLDGVKDPYGVKSTGMFKNTDCYSALQLTLTYSFMEKCRICNKD